MKIYTKKGARIMLSGLVVLMLLLPLMGITQAADKDCDSLVSKLQKRYDSTTDISAFFDQETQVAGASEPVKAHGQVYFKRPHLMRWDYDKPEKQLIVTSGSKVYLYEIEANQVSVLPRKQFLSSRVSRAFFFGKGDIRRDFNIKGCDLKDDQWILTLTPKEPIPQLKRLTLIIDPKRFLVKTTVIEDQMGGKTTIHFHDIKVNNHLSPKLFEFIPPKGVEIFNAS